jgi:hypothetical protein
LLLLLPLLGLLLLGLLLLGLSLLLLLGWRAAAAAARVVVLFARLPKPLPLLGSRLEAGGGAGGVAAAAVAAAAAGLARFSSAFFMLLLLLLLSCFVQLLLLSRLLLVVRLLLLSGRRPVLLLLLLSCLLRLVLLLLLAGPLRLPGAADAASAALLDFVVPAAAFVLASEGRDFLSALSEPAAAARFAEGWLLPAPAALLLPAAFLGFAEGAATRLRYCCITSVRLGVLLGFGCCLAAAATHSIWRTAAHRLLVRTTCRAPLHRSEGCSTLRMGTSNSKGRPFETAFRVPT